jgi:hypothetical protein
VPSVALGKLSDLQERILVALAEIDPPWTLSGGGALAGFHTAHRETRDLDLFWQGRRVLGDVVEKVRACLERAGLEGGVVQTQEAFARLNVKDGTAAVIVDLVADPVPLAEAPRAVTVREAAFLVDTPHQILVNKLCALLGRSEPRDLEDIMTLLEAGGDLSRALADCPQQDAGFSPVTLAWAVDALPLERLAAASGWPLDRIEATARFQRTFVDRVMRQARPDA